MLSCILGCSSMALCSRCFTSTDVIKLIFVPAKASCS
jgi:hypothetical protein